VIITVTPNPSVDRTIFVDALPRGAVIRSTRAQSEPSGKGVNVALALRTRGHPAVAVLPVGGPAGVQIVEMLRTADLEHIGVPIAGDIRTNISLVEPDGTVTKINEAGPQLDAAEVEALAAAALERTADGTWLACCGSLTAGAGAELYARLITEAHRRGVKAAIDTSGQALRAVLPYNPDLVKPNAHELAEAVDRPLETVGDVLDAARILIERGARGVLASLGADGAVLVEGDGVVHAEAPVATVASAVGAGDALLAGFLAVGGSGRTALANAMTWAAAAVQHGGTLLSASFPAAEVEIRDDIERERRLSEAVRAPQPASPEEERRVQGKSDHRPRDVWPHHGPGRLRFG
jgi:1-phosphofructokinase